MMLTKAILLGVAALVNVAVGTAPGRDPSQPMNATRYKGKPKCVDKPLLNPPVPDYSEYLVKELLHKTTNVVTMWNDSKINYECKKIFIKEGYNVEFNATALMNPTSLISMEECLAQTTVLAIMFFQSPRTWQDRIPEIGKIWALLYEQQIRMGLLFMVQRWTFCDNRFLEDSPVGLPNQLPDIEV